MIEDVPPVGFVYDKVAFCGSGNEGDDNEEAADENEADEDAVIALPEDAYYNPGETRGQFELRIKSYEIPIQETTYVDFVFNLPDDLPDIVHIVFGEAIISQPEHVHHFVMMGCMDKVDESMVGVAVDPSEIGDCRTQLGGWAPGYTDLFGNTDLSTGFVLGRSLGVQSIHLNVHYTDGAYADPDLETYKIATDGIRVFYTPDLRPYTSTRKALLSVAQGPKEIGVPSQTSRYYLTKTCHVNTKCKDATDETLQMLARFFGLGGTGEGDEGLPNLDGAGAFGVESANTVNADNANGMLANISCGRIKMMCFIGGEFGPIIQRLCPASCGLCEKSSEGEEENLRNPASYRVTAVNYHAHLLGREMYTTLIRDEEDTAAAAPEEVVAVATKKQALDTAITRNNMMVKDLKSREFWHYDDQATIPMDNEYTIDVAADGSNIANSIELMQGVEVKPGDKIQATCVYNSMDRTEDTEFGESTYEEMCLIGLLVTFETPPLNEGTANTIDFTADVNLRDFSCDVDQENHTSDIWQGILNEDEDARDIYFDHPISEADMCRFPILDLHIIDSISSGRAICPGDEDVDICHGFSSESDVEVEFLNNAIAGYNCVGGTYDGKDSNEANISKEDCIAGGGTEYNAYTCGDIEIWLDGEEAKSMGVIDEVKEYLRTEWYQPKCCTIPSKTEGISVDIASADSSSFSCSSATALLAMTAITLMLSLFY